MDRAEAIEILSERVSIGGTVEQNCMIGFGVNVDRLDAALDMAIAALREQEQSNEPLPYSQLWDMNGEPVWIVWPDGRIKSQWWIVGSQKWHMMEFMGAQSAKEYGTVWIAYRHKLGGAER